MDRPRNYHNKWSKSEKDKYHMISLIWGIFKKWHKWKKKRNYTNELIYKTEIDPHTKKTNMVTKEDIMGRDKLGVWDFQTHTTTYKIYKQQGSTV